MSEANWSFSTMIDLAMIQTMTLEGKRFVVLPEAEFERLLGEPIPPELPAALADGNYPAVETARALLARDLIQSRRALGWSQAELARRAGVRVETLNRLERGKHSANVATVDKLDRALKAGETPRRKSRGKTTGKAKPKK